MLGEEREGQDMVVYSEGFWKKHSGVWSDGEKINGAWEGVNMPELSGER
jgi:hypothetical protein